MKLSAFLPLLALTGCSAAGHDACSQDDPCAGLAPSFAQHVSAALSDTTGRFATDYPSPTPLTCELLGMLQQEMKDDSVRYHLEHLHQRYGDLHASAAFIHISRHNDFPLAMALTTHWNPDVRIEAVRAVNNYRRIRPMVCATQEHYARLELQDHAAVRYFIKVMETTPLYIPGSENSTIHSIYMQEVMRTLDLFTGQDHKTIPEVDLRIDRSAAGVQQCITDWRNWLEQ